MRERRQNVGSMVATLLEKGVYTSYTQSFGPLHDKP